MQAEERVQAQLVRATQRVAQLRARKLLHEMRCSARERNRNRRNLLRRRLMLGDTVISTGLGDIEKSDLIGLLMDARVRYIESPTLRMAVRKHGQEHEMSQAGT
jgi:hypothetical protein